MTQMLIMILAAMMAVVPAHSLPHGSESLQQKRQTSAPSSYEVETSRLITEIDNLAIAVKSALANSLNIAADSPLLGSTSPSFSLRSALGNMCTMKRSLTALNAAEDSLSASEDNEDDLELSAMKIVVGKSYQQNCEWLVSEASSDGTVSSAAEVDCNATSPFSDSAVELCTYWEALEVAEEAKKDLLIFYTQAHED